MIHPLHLLSGLNYFGSGVTGSMMTRAHIISWGYGFLRLRKAQT
ncbi:hypothetical protein HanXRQr2_Chr09g0403741 [Helianthus annuus]|uniref:Uncharacterized protein n=1 Tax=Helianthus annuus TaxID=4232 RepID=A0A9K3I967_HELAN|nr:hypothetical protein HanXRQr2_Chr09g0403741 [Helianthus annuus]KAJ0894493.1 hypothetical protein HanPSC8_Chr09g0389641 [Helianthus annuus]